MVVGEANRRTFIAALGGAAAWPVVARAQQQPAMSVVGFLSPGSLHAFAHEVVAFQQGLHETGYVDGHNVTMEYRWAEGRNERLPGLAADLITTKFL